jgi:hypothetical protein
MQEALAFVVMMLFASAYSVAAIAWLAAVALLWRTMAHRKAGVRLWSPELAYCPACIVFRPDLLTERGLQCRQSFGKAVLVFVTAVAVGLIVSGILRVLS